ncbi:MAG: hypothetical protein BACD_02108 [Bacteroides rodentium]
MDIFILPADFARSGGEDRTLIAVVQYLGHL